MCLEEINEVLAHSRRALGARDAGDQDGRQERTVVNVEVGACRGEVPERCVGEGRVCCYLTAEEGGGEEQRP